VTTGGSADAIVVLKVDDLILYERTLRLRAHGHAASSGCSGVPVMACQPNGPDAPHTGIPTHLATPVSTKTAGHLSFYSNGVITILAPRGWACSNRFAEDGSEPSVNEDEEQCEVSSALEVPALARLHHPLELALLQDGDRLFGSLGRPHLAMGELSISPASASQRKSCWRLRQRLPAVDGLCRERTSSMNGSMCYG
jgi:hypothetical protein